MKFTNNEIARLFLSRKVSNEELQTLIDREENTVQEILDQIIDEKISSEIEKNEKEINSRSERIDNLKDCPMTESVGKEIEDYESENKALKALKNILLSTENNRNLIHYVAEIQKIIPDELREE